VRIIAVGGCSSGVGKTSVVCRLLEALPSWGALKTTPVAGLQAIRGYALLRDESKLGRAGSDTARYFAAGAPEVAWLQYARGGLPAGLAEALPFFHDCPGVVVEGNSAVPHLPPSLVVLVARGDRVEIKDSAHAILPSADYVVINVPGKEDAAGIRARIEELSPRRIVTIDAERSKDPGTGAFLDEIRTWARSPS
jgi:molybdopterin-guanine dinucleotide biosynthesis protein